VPKLIIINKLKRKIKKLRMNNKLEGREGHIVIFLDDLKRGV